MARHTTTSAIRKYRSEYYRLMVEEARLNEQLHHMLKRIRKIAQDEKQSLANHIHLTNLLAQATLQKAEQEAQPVSKERNKQLKKAESVWKDITIQHKRNDLRLAVLDKKKDKDNATKYILKELKRDQIRIRAKAAYAIWKQLEQTEQYEFMDFEMFKALHFVKTQKQIASNHSHSTRSTRDGDSSISPKTQPSVEVTHSAITVYSRGERQLTSYVSVSPRIYSPCILSKREVYSVAAPFVRGSKSESVSDLCL
ncbi:hypothetical protein [Xanthocytophaga agilis]|uniref:Uncharacterized protein n=1 Tax=Xanthocytophaga agilis TaxID=3048010 RepID=A0AAE3QXR7_9BACT|nr:hypothetical protein [Xanthocytophaga agilis]MDJ1499971.1 hypothetical protein [Xanthocytophaga agilis]